MVGGRAALCVLLASSFSLGCDDLFPPTVDLRAPDAASNLVDAFQTWGFAYLSGHGVDHQVAKDAAKEAKRFFRLPERVKRQVKADRAPVYRRPVSFGKRRQTSRLNLSQPKKTTANRASSNVRKPISQM